MRGGGFIVPFLTALLAFLVGGLVVLRHRREPDHTYKAIFEGSGLNWLFPWVTGDDRHARRAEPAADAAADDAADPHRPGRRLRLPRRPVQHRRPGPVPRRHHGGGLRRLALDGTPALLHVVLAVLAALPRRRGVGGHRRRAQGDDRRQRGDLDDHAQLDRGLRRQLPVRPRRAAAERRPQQQSIPVSDDVRRARGCRSSGATRSCRGCTSASSSRWPWPCCSGCCSTAR